MMRASAAFGLLFTIGIFFYIDSSKASLPERENITAQVRKGSQARRLAGHTLHKRSYYPRKSHARRLSRWQHHKPVKPVGVQPAGYRAERPSAEQTTLLAQATSTIGSTARQLGVPTSLWCADAVNLWLRRSGLPTVKSRHARAFIPYGTALSAPRPGAIAVFARGPAPYGHVGIVSAVNGNKVKVISGNCLGRVCVSEYPASRALAWRWPGRGPVAEPPRDLAKVIPLPRPRPVLAADFAELEIIPPTFNLALLDSEAMPVALSVIDVEPEPVPSSRNIFEAFADNLLQPVGNCRGWDRIAPGVKRIASDATRHFSRKYGRVLIAAANSCVRDAKRNREVGGAKFSAHLRGTALDFKIIAPDRSFTVGERELWLFCKSHRLAKGCGIYKMKGIIHADVDVRLGKRAWNWTGRRPTRLAKVKHKKKKYAKKKVKGKWRYASR